MTVRTAAVTSRPGITIDATPSVLPVNGRRPIKTKALFVPADHASGRSVAAASNQNIKRVLQLRDFAPTARTAATKASGPTRAMHSEISNAGMPFLQISTDVRRSRSGARSRSQ